MDTWQANPEPVDPRYHAIRIMHAFERVCRTSGMTHATFHDLRPPLVTHARRADNCRVVAMALPQKSELRANLFNLDRKPTSKSVANPTFKAKPVAMLGHWLMADGTRHHTTDRDDLPEASRRRSIESGHHGRDSAGDVGAVAANDSS
jgi:hypothetical protein